jgi:hypothetical protein
VTVTMDAALRVDLAGTISRDSSRGPARASGQIKPQISAPGMRVFAAKSGSGTEGVTYDGTSMSGPMVTGVAALLWQRNMQQHLDLQPLDIAALAMNYANPSIYMTPEELGGERAPVARQGAGLVDAYRSGKAMTVVRSAEGIAELSFGEVQPSDRPLRLVRKLSVHNLSEDAKTYEPGYVFDHPAEDADHGVTISFDPPTLTVAGGGTADLNVAMTVDPASVRQPWGLRGTDAIREETQMTLYEVDGWVSLTEVDAAMQPVFDGDRPLVPFYVLPRAASCVLTDPGGAAGHPGPHNGQQLRRGRHSGDVRAAGYGSRGGGPSGQAGHPSGGRGSGPGPGRRQPPGLCRAHA